MAKLTTDQQQAVSQWVAEGASLNDVQTRLKEDFSINLTYFDTRLLVMEMGLTIQDKNRPTTPEPAETPAEEPQPALSNDTTPLDDNHDEAPLPDLPDEPIGNSNISVSLDTLAIPGTMVSGKATFSDGITASWYLDQFGRLGLRDAPQNYEPPAKDIPAFQRELQKLLR